MERYLKLIFGLIGGILLMMNSLFANHFYGILSFIINEYTMGLISLIGLITVDV